MRYIIIMIILLSNTGFLTAQNDSISIINGITIKYQQVRKNLQAYDVVKADLTGVSTETAQGTAYYDGNDLKVIEVIYLAETGHKQTEYYFDNGYLYFALERNQSSEKTILLNKKGKENNKTRTQGVDNATVTENWYYFHEEKLVRWLDNGRKEVDIHTKTNSMVGEGLIAHAYKMKEKLKK